MNHEKRGKRQNTEKAEREGEGMRGGQIERGGQREYRESRERVRGDRKGEGMRGGQRERRGKRARVSRACGCNSSLPHQSLCGVTGLLMRSDTWGGCDVRSLYWSLEPTDVPRHTQQPTRLDHSSVCVRVCGHCGVNWGLSPETIAELSKLGRWERKRGQ